MTMKTISLSVHSVQTDRLIQKNHPLSIFILHIQNGQTTLTDYYTKSVLLHYKLF